MTNGARVGVVACELLFLALCGEGCLAAQSNDDLKAIRKDIEDLRRGQEGIQNTLAEISASIRGKGPAAVTQVSLSVEGAAFKGEKGAPVTLIEFTDYQCPFCGRHAAQVLPEIVAEYVKTGKVKYVIRDYPLSSHLEASKAAEAAYCAGEQGKYWGMHDLLFANQKGLKSNDFSALARSLELTEPDFADCLASGRNSSRVAASLKDADAAGVDAAPTFYLALTDPDGSTVKAVTKLVGAVPYSTFKDSLDKLISSNQGK